MLFIIYKILRFCLSSLRLFSSVSVCIMTCGHHTATCPGVIYIVRVPNSNLPRGFFRIFREKRASERLKSSFQLKRKIVYSSFLRIKKTLRASKYFKRVEKIEISVKRYSKIFSKQKNLNFRSAKMTCLTLAGKVTN